MVHLGEGLLMRQSSALFIRCALTAMIIAGSAFAQDSDRDPNIDPILPDPVPSPEHFPPAKVTSGTARPAPMLSSAVVSASILKGRGPGCTPASPCAAVVPSAGVDRGQ
jgi:hypothetical protein